MRKRRKSGRPKKRRQLKPNYVLVPLVVLCVGLMLASLIYQEQLKPVRVAVGNLITPMQRGINSVGRYLSDRLDSLATVNALLEENAELKRGLEQAQYENRLLQQELYELDGIRDLLQLDEMYSNYPKVAAHIIGRDTNQFYNIFWIDKGEEDGIKVDMNVLAGYGLAGIVTEVGGNWAKVRSIIDDTSSVSGMFMKTTDTCLVNGNLTAMESGYLDVSMISMDAAVEDSYEVVTSHISDKYLQGILIGYIYDIEIDASNMMKQAKLIPIVDFKHLEEVLVITELKSTYE